MSSLPGLTLEDYVAWNYNIVVSDLDDHDPNPSLRIAEALGNIPERPRLTSEQFAAVLSPFEPLREYVERRLSDFDEETQSWRDYAGYAFDIPDAVYEAGQAALDAARLKATSAPPAHAAPDDPKE